MMRPTLLGLLVVGLIAAVGLTWLLRPERTRQGPTREPDSRSLPIAGFQGIASCSASACHGSGIPGGPGGEVASWASYDPHARAYAVLLEDRSRVIEKKLHPGQGEPRPERNELCLNCHVQPGIMQADRSPRFALAEGVGCESCHGASESWLHEHTLPGWKRWSAGQKQDLGMRDTANLRVRAEVCVTCHVGKENIEVNHDLIAAGHPRLRFEFAAYLANYPPHWRPDRDRERFKDLEARAWVAGQAASATAALRLLAHRASSPSAVWPELAEHDCYACHHDLAPRGWRQALTAGPASREGLPRRAKPGALLLNEWYYAALPVVADRVDLAPLARLMARPVSSRAGVAAEATKLARELAGESLAVPDPNTLLAALAAEGVRTDRPGWDRDTQRYLGAAALTQGGMGANAGGLAAAVAELESLLQGAFLAGPGPLDSPAGYEPDAVRKRWQTIRERLRKTNAP